jgi:hypothetical protein
MLLFCLFLAGGELYSGTVADFSASDALIIRDRLRTEQFDLKHLNGKRNTKCNLVRDKLSAKRHKRTRKVTRAQKEKTKFRLLEWGNSVKDGFIHLCIFNLRVSDRCCLCGRLDWMELDIRRNDLHVRAI